MSAAADFHYEYLAEVRTTPPLGRAIFSALAPERSPVQAVVHDAVAERNGRLREALFYAIQESAENDVIVSSSAVENFPAFLSLLPSIFPASEPYISEEGSICIDWYDDPQNQISILLQNDHKIGYAAYFAGEQMNGSAEFSPDAFPSQLSDLVNRWALVKRRRASPQG